MAGSIFEGELKKEVTESSDLLEMNTFTKRVDLALGEEPKLSISLGELQCLQ